VHRTGPVAAQLERDILGAAVPGGEPGDEDVHDGAVHVPVQLDAAVRARVDRPAAGRAGVPVRAVRGHAQPAGVRVPERRVPQGDAARGVQPQTVARVGHRGGLRGRLAPAAPVRRVHAPTPPPPVGQRVRAQFPHVVRRVPALVRLGHAAARRLRRHVQPGKCARAKTAAKTAGKTVGGTSRAFPQNLSQSSDVAGVPPESEGEGVASYDVLRNALDALRYFA